MAASMMRKENWLIIDDYKIIYMKKLILPAVLVLLATFTSHLSPLMAADANVYFENADNYDAYNAGNGKIHVKVLVFGEKGDHNYNAGRGKNHNLGNDYDPTPDATGSRMYSERTDVTNDRTIQLYYWGDNYYNRSASSGSHHWPKDKGVVWVQLQSGVLVCTNTYEGIDRTVTADGTVVQIELKRKDEGGHRTYFEFDWYPPTNLDSHNFMLKVMSDHHRSGSSTYYSKEHNFGEFSGADPQVAPMITEPFIYTANEHGIAGYGKLAMVYMSTSEISKYYTSQDTREKALTEASGMIYVGPSDTVRHGFRVRFWELRSTDKTTWRWVWSNKVDIPAYHKIYNFQINGYEYHREDIDKNYIDYRYKKLTWEISYPQEEDVMEGDAFEIQRAYKADFSDAQTIDVIPFAYDSATTVNDIQTYTYVDSTEAAWWNPEEQSYRIYYRIRRASSAVWEWTENPYAVSSYWSGLSTYYYYPTCFTSESRGMYTLDENFAENHEVHFKFYLKYTALGTRESQPGMNQIYIDPHQRLMMRKILVENHDTILIEIPHDSVVAAFNKQYYALDYDEYRRSSFILNYTDRANTPCVHYQYEAYMDTTGVIVKTMPTTNENLISIPEPIYHTEDVYFTEAANINTFAGSDKDYPECVLLTWEPTDGNVGTYSIETRPNDQSAWVTLVSNLDQNWYQDRNADPLVSEVWQYRLTMRYECNGNQIERSAITTGSRYPYGKVSGRVMYADGTGCSGIEVNASRVSDGIVLQRRYTDESGYYLFDSLPYYGDAQYAITPVSQTAEFRYNNTSATFASITLSLDRCIATGIDFENISSVRVSGRVLYENSTIPVRDANFLVNGKIVQVNGRAYNTNQSGNFEFAVPKDEAFTLQAVKDGHIFAGEGFVRMEDDSLLTLSKPLDGIRIYDRTRVRLIGRLAGGNIQASKPLGHGLSTNYLGDDLKLVFELEGDNISQIVHFPSDPDKDTVHQRVDSTATLFEKKRITVYPDVNTGEYAVDLFPVRYKITQATARGYATLFAAGKTSETLDLSEVASVHKEDVYENDTVRFNASYSITYHSPISITCKQLRYGLEVGWYGEESMIRKNIINEKVLVPLAQKQADGSYTYLFGAPVFAMDNYSFRVSAHEDYYFNNDESSTLHEEVRIKGGRLKVYNGMHDNRTTEIENHDLDSTGQVDITIPVDYISVIKTGEDALRVLDLSVEYEGAYVEKQALKAYVSGNQAKGSDFVTSTHGNIVLLDILRDPPGSQSYAYIEEGTTYKYNYSYKFDFEFGLNITLGYGAQATMSLGSYAGSPAGVYAGYVNNYSTENKFDLPISTSYLYHKTGSYTFTTTSRIETDNEKYFVDQTGNGKYFVGQEADVYIGAIQNLYYGITDAVKPIDSLTYASLHSRDIYNAIRVVNSGRDRDGKLWYLVIGEETEAGTYINSSFIYTHDYIENTLLPQLRKQRNELLYTGDSATVQSIADALGKPVYWSKIPAEDVAHFADSGTYVMMVPAGSTKVYDNEVDAYNRQIAQWIDQFVRNETEKVNAIYGTNKQKIGTWSVSGGTLVSHNETYEYGAMYTKRVDYPGGSLNFDQGLVKTVTNAFGSTVANQIAQKWLGGVGPEHGERKTPYEIVCNAPTGHMIFDLTPILDMDFDYTPETGTTHTKKTGFVLEPDNFGHESVSVYRVVDAKDRFNGGSEDIRDFVSNNSVGNLIDNTPDSLYGSFVYFLEGGASRCPYEQAYTTSCYKPAVLLSAGSMNLENQKLDINVHERSNVPADQPAVFQLRLANESDGDFGGAAAAITFYLKQKEGTNSHGARLIIDGMPLTGDGRAIKIAHDEVITKTMQVYAGDGYDYENIVLELASPCDPYNKVACTFSVHYTPVSCPVNITAPHDKWVMNTLSSQDSVGYYLPVVIDGFDVNYNGFDHIEFQYKLSTQSDDAWVNLCSYYADDSLYNAASGNKEMIKGGRIENVHFYGERDPMEQQYDLRAVSFCRYGNGFIYRASPVLVGIKDTRPPRVFGQPEPANSILGVGDNLILRFNEPIAGNYLDEDNNFQITGITNETGITTGTSLVFDYFSGTYAETKVNRSLSGSFSIDLLVKPTETDQDEVFFMHGDGKDLLLFGKTGDNKLWLSVGNDVLVKSRKLDALMTAFTRVIVTYDHETGLVRFYAGTQEVTDPARNTPIFFEHPISAPLNFGYGFVGGMLEARIWTKALTPAEIANTHLKYLTGFERELLAYYPMNEGQGEALTDKANGATLFLHGATWNFEKGISLHIPATDSVELAGDLLARSSIQDETLMFWFKTNSQSGNLFTAASGFRLALENGNLVLYSENQKLETINHKSSDGAWHHLVLTINRVYNNVSLFVDEQMVHTAPAATFGSISGRMVLGGGGFEGNIDELAVFEQALPKSFVENYSHISPYGDEMGLMAYLPFQETKENESGIIELVFSVNDQRQFKTSDGKILHKEVPLIPVTGNPSPISSLADKANHAPVRTQGLLTKLNFDWSFNNDELLINLNMQDKEINKQTIYITVRDVEDLNGNPMASPVMWTAFVDHNSLKWEDDDLDLHVLYGQETAHTAYRDFQIINNSGKRHQYTIESLPDWLSVDNAYGSIEPMQDKAIRFYYNTEMPVGQYMDIVYLTDENGLSEPLEVEYTVEAIPPYEEINKGLYPLTMSVCGQVRLTQQSGTTVVDSDPDDRVYVLYRHECVGMANIEYDNLSNSSALFLTIYGNEAMTGKPLTFQLWQASTGKTLILTPDRDIVFRSGDVIGCSNEKPVMLVTSGSETQNINLQKGWNWISTNLRLKPASAPLNNVMTVAEPWKEGDLIKNPESRQFSTYSEVMDVFMGTLSAWDYTQMYMIYSAQENILRLNGENLLEYEMKLTFHGSSDGSGQWSPLPFLLNRNTSVAETMAGYYEYATPGDVIKSHDAFATFSTDRKWIGNLKTMRPGEGYFLRRLAPTDVTVPFYNQPLSAGTPKRSVMPDAPAGFHTSSATNMTMIATLNSEALNAEGTKRDAVAINVYIGSDLVGVASPLSNPPLSEASPLYFLTIQSDKVGELRFETEDGTLLASPMPICYEADAHHGSLQTPVILKPSENSLPYKILEDNHVVIIRNNEKYDVTGKKL